METHKKNQNDIAFPMNSNLQFCNKKVEKYIFSVLEGIANNDSAIMGAIVVFGDFSQFHQCEGLIQMKPKQNPITSLIMINTEEGAKVIETFSQFPYDGAIIVDKAGQIVGAGIYLKVEHPTLDIPDGCGTRHKSAASFSLHNDTISVLTLSEETNIIRVWRDGKEEKQLKVKLGEIK